MNDVMSQVEDQIILRKKFIILNLLFKKIERLTSNDNVIIRLKENIN